MVYEGILKERGNSVSEEDAYSYALGRIHESEELKKEFEDTFKKDIIEWFYSGDWTKEDTER